MAKRIMVVQGAFMQRVIRNALPPEEYEIIAETDKGGACVALYREYKPDLVIMDTTYTDETEFGALLSALRNEDPPARVLMCSQLMDPDENPGVVMAAIKRGAADYIKKPFKPEQLLAKVRKLCS